MRYPWKDMYEQPLELGDNVIDLINHLGGVITTDEFGVPCIYMTHQMSNGSWKRVDNKGPKEMYMKPLFNTKKSRLYWYFHRYILNHIIKGEENEFQR